MRPGSRRKPRVASQRRSRTADQSAGHVTPGDTSTLTGRTGWAWGRPGSTRPLGGAGTGRGRPCGGQCQRPARLPASGRRGSVAAVTTALEDGPTCVGTKGNTRARARCEICHPQGVCWLRSLNDSKTKSPETRGHRSEPGGHFGLFPRSCLPRVPGAPRFRGALGLPFTSCYVFPPTGIVLPTNRLVRDTADGRWQHAARSS